MSHSSVVYVLLGAVYVDHLLWCTHFYFDIFCQINGIYSGFPQQICFCASRETSHIISHEPNLFSFHVSFNSTSLP